MISFASLPLITAAVLGVFASTALLAFFVSRRNPALGGKVAVAMAVGLPLATLVLTLLDSAWLFAPLAAIGVVLLPWTAGYMVGRRRLYRRGWRGGRAGLLLTSSPP